jgi:hypothetical protein
MKPRTLLGSLLGATLLGAVTCGCATSQAKLESQARVSKAEAGRTALARAPGSTIKEAELEKEEGTLVWSFDLATPGTADLTEVSKRQRRWSRATWNTNSTRPKSASSRTALCVWSNTDL